jgi:hypothetical protein
VDGGAGACQLCPAGQAGEEELRRAGTHPPHQQQPGASTWGQSPISVTMPASCPRMWIRRANDGAEDVPPRSAAGRVPWLKRGILPDFIGMELGGEREVVAPQNRS